MSLNKHVILAIATVIYSAVFLTAADVLNESVMIPSVALIGLCGWWYGTRAGLFSVLFYTILNASQFYLESTQLHDMLIAFNPVGILIGTVVAIATGALKKSCDKLDVLKLTLSARIDQATDELEKIARQLIERDEQERIQVGQDIHDGVGQYLTSMLLHCEALSLNLKKEGHTETELAENMTLRVERSIQTIRQLARSLLPIQFSETTMETALEEMTAYFGAYSKAKIRLTCHGDSAHIPTPIAQHFYRIIHEALYRAICNNNASNLDIRLVSGKRSCRSTINGVVPPEYIHSGSHFVSDMMEYRIGAIGGRHSYSNSAKGGFRLECAAGFDERVGW